MVLVWMEGLELEVLCAGRWRAASGEACAEKEASAGEGQAVGKFGVGV